MKPTLATIAQATAALITERPASEHECILDAAVALLERHGMRRSFRFFSRALVAAVQKRTGTLGAIVCVPNMPSPSELDALTHALHAATDRPVAVHVEVDPALLGGASLSVGDERVDCSVGGLLRQLQIHLCASSFSASSV